MSRGGVGCCLGKHWGGGGAFCGRHTVADVAPLAAVDVVVLASTNAVVALVIKCIHTNTSVEYQLYINRIYMMPSLSEY